MCADQYVMYFSVSHNNVWMCADEFDKRRSDKLKAHMQEYFEKQPMLEEGKVSMLSFSREMDVEEYEKFTEKVQNTTVCVIVEECISANKDMCVIVEECISTNKDVCVIVEECISVNKDVCALIKTCV